MRATPVRLITGKESDLESMNIAASHAHIWSTAHAMDRSKFLGMSALDGVSGVKELRCYELAPVRVR